MADLLIVYSSTDGHTLEICQRLQQIAEASGHDVCLLAVEDAASIELARFDRIVIGARIRYGRHSELVYRFIRNHKTILAGRANAFFSVNVVARKPGKDRPETNPYLLKFLREIDWKPQHLAVFAGKIEYRKYSPVDRLMIRLIMWLTKGPTAADTIVDFTDWQQVAAFGKTICAMTRPAD